VWEGRYALCVRVVVVVVSMATGGWGRMDGSGGDMRREGKGTERGGWNLSQMTTIIPTIQSIPSISPLPLLLPPLARAPRGPHAPPGHRALHQLHHRYHAPPALFIRAWSVRCQFG
jgi:hypothetical protein